MIMMLWMELAMNHSSVNFTSTTLPSLVHNSGGQGVKLATILLLIIMIVLLCMFSWIKWRPNKCHSKNDKKTCSEPPPITSGGSESEGGSDFLRYGLQISKIKSISLEKTKKTNV